MTVLNFFRETKGEMSLDTTTTAETSLMSSMSGVWPLPSTSTPMMTETPAPLIPLEYEANNEDNDDDIVLSGSSSLLSSIQFDL